MELQHLRRHLRSLVRGVRRTTTTNPSSLDIEHIVATQDAWDNGASTWNNDTRLQFSHDPLVIVAVSSSENRFKGSRGPAQWKASNKVAWPAYAQLYIPIKHSYDLRLSSEAERNAEGDDGRRLSPG